MRSRLLPLCAGAAALLAACRDDQISTYRVPKETPPATAGLANAAAGAPAIHWKKPADWQEQPLDSVRVGSFLVSGANGTKADMSVTTFPGDVGGDLANVNRWRSQLGLAPVGNDELAQAVQTVSAPAGNFSWVDLSGERAVAGAQKPARMFGAWLKQPDRTWFFKLMGDDALVGAQREAFISFLKSVEIVAAPVAAGPVQGQSTNDLPKNTPPPFAPFASGALPDAGGAPAALSWTAPAGWTAKPLGSMRIGSFSVGHAGSVADISIIGFPGEAGGLLANVNRWRGQLGLAPLADSDLAGATTVLEGTGGLHFTVVDFSGQADGAPTRMLGAILPFGGQTYFFKMTGPDQLIATQRDAFRSFLQSVTSAANPAPAQQATGLPSPVGIAPPDSETAPPRLTWVAPSRWQSKPLGSMRLGSYSVSGAEGTADISVIAFPGEAGGVMANVNRWRGQLGQAPLGESGVAGATFVLNGATGLHFIVVDIAGLAEGAPARLLGAIVAFGGQTYFFKMTGPDVLVAREETAFLDFLKSVKTP
ncbi:MAG: hypothetical protein ABSE59_09040 [Opitutaceae bacterium]|jgi:hypothetical protein